MRKAIVYAYALVGVLIVPSIIGGGVADFLLAIYDNFSRHWIAGFAVCLLTGAVASWIPMLLLVESEDVRFSEKGTIRVAALIGWVGGILAPLIDGFQHFSDILMILLILTTGMTISSVLPSIRKGRM